MSVRIKEAGKVAKVAFQFFRLREKVTQLKSTVFERQYHGAIVVWNSLKEWKETETLVEDLKERREARDFDDKMMKDSGSSAVPDSPGCYRRKDQEELDCGPFDARVSRGSGSLEVSNLAVGCYEVEVRRKDRRKLECGPLGCRRVVKVNRDKTVRVVFPSTTTSTAPPPCDP